MLFQPRVLLEDDLLPLDPHVTGPLCSLVVLHSARPVLVVLTLHRHVRLLSALPAGNGEKTVSQSKCGHQVKVQLYNVHFEVRMKEETSFAL